MKEHLIKIEEILINQTLITLEKAKTEVGSQDSGFYWIYTKLGMEEFSQSPRPTNPVHVDFQKLAGIHRDLKNVIYQTSGNYWCIYNGKGKQLKNRIAAEFTDTSGKTGKLALLRCFNETDFRIKFVSCGRDNYSKGLSVAYDVLKRDLERIWRLNNGWPFLCRR